MVTLALPNGARPGARLELDSPWSYTCGRCGNCCKDKDFIVTPYDVARLAEGLGMASPHVMARFVDPSRPALQTTAEGVCVFFQPGAGCTVHEARPAVCRLYPLGRTVTKEGRVVFEEAEPHPETAGLYGAGGTVAAYLEAQGTGPYLQAMMHLGAFLEDAFAVASRADVLQHVDDAVHAYWTGEGGPVPFNILGVDLLVSGGVMDDPLELLIRHLAALRALCGMDTPKAAQARMGETASGRAQLGRLVITAAVLGVGLGLSPGFSQDAPGGAT